MGNEDWYRRRTWTAADQEAFRARLRRSRSDFHRAQYLRIQALSLQETGDRGLCTSAIGLLDELVSTYPDASQLAAAHLQRAQCLDLLESPDEAATAFRAALEAQRLFPNWQTTAPLDFGMFCVRRGMESLYEEGVAMLDEFAHESPFPAAQFQEAVVRAVVAEHQGDVRAAGRFARMALDAAARESTGLRFHKRLGLVGKVPGPLRKKLQRLAKAAD